MTKKPDFARSVWLKLLNLGTEIDTFFNGIDVPVDSEFLVAHRLKDYVQLTEVYRLKNGYPLQKQVFGEIDARNNVLNTTDIGFYGRRNDLSGLTMEAITIHVSVSPFIGVYVASLTCHLVSFNIPVLTGLLHSVPKPPYSPRLS
jgi:hypothetical protein